MEAILAAIQPYEILGHSFHSLRRPARRLIVYTLFVAALFFGSANAVAQSPTPDSDIVVVGPGKLPCVGMPQTHGFIEDAGLAINNFKATVKTVPGQFQPLVDEVTLSWTPPPASTGLLCLALFRTDPDGTQVSAGTEMYPFLGTKLTYAPGGGGPEPYTTCWRLQAVADGRVGPSSSACATIEHPLRPVVPQDPTPEPEPTALALTPGPPSPAGTPQPPATGARSPGSNDHASLGLVAAGTGALYLGLLLSLATARRARKQRPVE